MCKPDPGMTNLAVICHDAERSPGEVDAGHGLREDLRAEPGALLPELLCELAPEDAVGEAGAADCHRQDTGLVRLEVEVNFK